MHLTRDKYTGLSSDEFSGGGFGGGGMSGGGSVSSGGGGGGKCSFKWTFFLAEFVYKLKLSSS